MRGRDTMEITFWVIRRSGEEFVYAGIMFIKRPQSVDREHEGYYFCEYVVFQLLAGLSCEMLGRLYAD